MKSFIAEIRLFNSHGFVPIKSATFTVKASTLRAAAGRAVATAAQQVRGRRVQSLSLTVRKI